MKDLIIKFDSKSETINSKLFEIFEEGMLNYNLGITKMLEVEDYSLSYFIESHSILKGFFVLLKNNPFEFDKTVIIKYFELCCRVYKDYKKSPELTSSQDYIESTGNEIEALFDTMVDCPEFTKKIGDKIKELGEIDFMKLLNKNSPVWMVEYCYFMQLAHKASEIYERFNY